ncbi:MAG: hypothetical protein OXN17_11575 [Candidatus Poribacteria bacterium]|nr:hypothetical protein [Candidatus Poribacteria bacterium]MDE0505694.1 hypothetical protein [Candidatus Poribacteria bacterium]
MTQETKKNEIVPVAEYEVLDQVDDRAIVEMMTGQAIEDYVYSFKQGGRTVEGLTLAGINEAANRRGGIQIDSVDYEEREHSWLAIAKATDTVTGSSRYGAYEQVKAIGNRSDPHAFTKAIHKAQRNAIKQLLPVHVIKEVLSYYLNRQAPPTKSQTEAPPPQDKISDAQKAAFALSSKLKGRFGKQGIPQSDFWSYVRRRYGVESRNDMTEQQWTQLSAELKAAEKSKKLFNQLLIRIRQFEAAVEASEVPESPESVASSNEKEPIPSASDDNDSSPEAESGTAQNPAV